MELTKEELKWLEGSVYIAILQMDVMIEEMGSMGWERKHLTFLQKLRKKLNKSLVAQEIIGE